MLKMISPIEKKSILLVILMGFLVCGCSTNRKSVQNLSPHNVAPAHKILDNAYWWHCNFKNVWPDNKRIDWGVDLLLAHAVVYPVLIDHINDISYWHFHRRAARDNAGHQFSCLFYSSPEVAAVVFSEIDQSKVLKGVIEANLVKKVLMDDPNNPQLPNVEDTSDQNWSMDIQKNWPSFIMGVSAFWLGLIDASMQDSPQDYTDAHQLLEKYREVDTKITDTWRKEGQHALLHHLNAVFGYEPLYIRNVLSF